MRLVGKLTSSDRGQGTVEYALVLYAFVAMLVGMAAVWHALSDGVLVNLATDSASHASGDGLSMGSLQDLLLY